MKIISLNTWAGVVEQPLLNFLEKNIDTDIFCFQEIYHNAQGKVEIDDDTKREVFDLFSKMEKILCNTHNGYFCPALHDFYGLAIFVKKNIVVKNHGGCFIHETEWTKRGNHSRNLQYITIELAGEPLVIVNVHGLWNGMGKTDTEDRISQSKRIKEFLDSQAGSKVVIGDFNLSPDTQSLAIVEKGMVNLIKKYDIQSTRTSLYTKDNKFADYAIITPSIEVKDFKVLPDEVSDHSPLLLEI